MIPIMSRLRGNRGRRLRAGALGGISAMMLAAGLAWPAAPAAQAGTVFYEVAWQTNPGGGANVGGFLAEDGVQNDGALTGLERLARDSSPSITFTNGNNLAGTPGGLEAAYQDDLGELDTFGPNGFFIWATDVKSGTSPSITPFADGGVELAYINTAGDVITLGNDGGGNWGRAQPGTSPSITDIGLGDTYEVAFQNAAGNLVTVGPFDDHGPWALGMMAGTSPAITALTDGGYQVAFQANTGSLWTVHSGAAGGRNLALGMMAGTNPAITLQPNGSYEIAFQANTGVLWTVSSDAMGHNWNLGMKPGTSPAITNGPTGGNFEIAFQANTGQVWTVGEDNHNAWNSDNSTMPGTNPSITKS